MGTVSKPDFALSAELSASESSVLPMHPIGRLLVTSADYKTLLLE